MSWKAIAIIFIVIQVLEIVLVISFIGYAIYLVNEEEEQKDQCYYNICEDYPEAEVVDGLCYCYDYNEEGNDFVLAKTKLI